jgi:hypothetical protein
MLKPVQLTGSEKDLFAIVGQAAFINPFSDERTELDAKIAGQHPGASKSTRLKKAVKEVSSSIDRLQTEGRSDLNAYQGRDRQLVQKAFLFEMFYRYKSKFDELIHSQITAGNTPAKIPFYGMAMDLMLSRGFSETDFRHYFALGFQARRAFYFIDRTLVGGSPCMKILRRDLWNNVFTHNFDYYARDLWNRLEDFSTLILGETGTGKGTAAAAIGRSGFIPLDKRKKSFVESFTRSFVSINLSQFPESLIESELFGHKKGAFTGAIEDHKGVFDQCSPYGSIFLDEIGEVSPPIQIKLLHVLQDRVFTPVGSRKTARFHGRAISASNQSFKEIRETGRFRDDFYYRLCSDMITVPPLRQRIQEDAGELNQLLSFTTERLLGKPAPETAEKVHRVINANLGPEYPWPGNVRELEQCIRRVLLKGNYVPDSSSAPAGLDARLKNGIELGTISAQDLISGYCALLHYHHDTFEEVARRTGLDRRTVKKYIQEWQENGAGPV